MILTKMIRLAVVVCLRMVRLLSNWRRLRALLQILRAIPGIVVGVGIFALGGVAVDQTLNLGWAGASLLAVGLWLLENTLVEPRLESWAHRHRIRHVQQATVGFARLQLKSYDIPFLDELRKIARSSGDADASATENEAAAPAGASATESATEEQSPPVEEPSSAAPPASLRPSSAFPMLTVGTRVRASFISLGIVLAEGVIGEINTTEHGATEEAPLYRIDKDDGTSVWYPGILLDII